MKIPSFLTAAWNRCRSAARATWDWLCTESVAFGADVLIETRGAKTAAQSAALHVYGWIAQTPDQRDQTFISTVPTAQMPALVDLRPLLPPLPCQGQSNACVANAVALAVQYSLITKRLPAGIALPSRLFVYYFARFLELTQNSDAGCQPRDAIKTLAQRGICPEATWPYDLSKVIYMPSDEAQASAAKEVALKYGAVTQTAEGIKGALASGFPVVLGIAVYDSFETPAVTASGVVPIPAVGEKLKGAHCILVVAYDDSNGRFTFANWWGEQWGFGGGYGSVPYEYLTRTDLCRDLWVVEAMK